MKKILALILTFILVFSLTAIAVSADANDGDQCLRGESVTVLVALPEEYQSIKAASVEFFYDEDVFTCVSYKWIPKLVVKSYDPATKKGVAANSSASAWSGNLFELKLTVNEAAAYGDYEIVANVQLQNSANEFIPVTLTYAYSVVEYIEVDTEITPADVANAVENVKNAKTAAEKYDAIVEANAKYSELTTKEKEEAADAYSELLQLVEDYNESGDEINAEAKEATYAGFSAISKVFDYISKLFAALCNMIWN